MLNHLPSFSSLPIFDVSRGRPFQLLRYAPVALRLMRRGRLPLRPESVREPAQLRRVLAALDMTTGEDA